MFQTILNSIFPPICVHCSREGAWLCAQAEVMLRAEPIFQYQEKIPGIDRVIIRGSYDCAPLQAIIQKIKYHGWHGSRDVLATLIKPLIPELQSLPDHTVIVPIPLHPRRQRERGFNQAELIAKSLANMTGFPIKHLLQRQRYTKPQAQLLEDERHQNVVDAFRLSGKNGANSATIILVDDVITTGSTMRSAATILHEQGFQYVYALALAKG